MKKAYGSTRVGLRVCAMGCKIRTWRRDGRFDYIVVGGEKRD